jgi:SAM-dependent methyltransferase
MDLHELAGAAGAHDTASASAVAIRRQRRVWSRRVHSWESHGSAALEKVTEAVLAAAGPVRGCTVVDLGCGTGAVSLPMATAGARVLAVDVSDAMLDRLRSLARDQLNPNGAFPAPGSITALAAPVESLSLPAASVDLVVSSYALHHLRDRDKAGVVASAFGWLRPGGQLLIADMMLGRGGDAHDRAVIAGKVARLAAKGPGGWWRIGKNAFRYLLRVHERPLPLSRWADLLKEAGFVDVAGDRVVAEAAWIRGRRPVET